MFFTMIRNKNPQDTCLGIIVKKLKGMTKQLPKVVLQKNSFIIPWI
jgi:hypothetical protein